MLIRLVTLLLAFGPGGLLGFLVRPGRERWATWACAPILSLGLTSFGVAWLPALGLPNGTVAVLVAELVVVAVAVAVSRLLAARRTESAGSAGSAGSAAAAGSAGVSPTWLRPWPSARRRSLPTRDLVAVAVPAVLALGFGRLMLGQFRFPIGWDAQNHAVLVGNILQTGSTSISDACSTGSTVRVTACNFYPLAVDVSWAQAADFTGGAVSHAMTTWSMFVGPLALVAALYTAVRVMGGRRIVASCAAGAAIVVGSLWEQQLAGRATGAIPAFGVMIALLVAVGVKDREPVRLGLLAGLASAGLLMTHTYDAFFAGTLALAMVFTLRGRLRITQTALALGTLAVVAFLTMAPLLSDLLGASSGRPTRHPLFAHHLGRALNYWFTDLRRYSLFGYPVPGSVHALPDLLTMRVAVWLTVPCIIASPLCFAFARLRWGRPWLITWAFWTLIGIWTTYSTSGPAADLAHTWYGDPQRLRDMIYLVYPLMAVIGACAIGSLVQLLLVRLRPHLSEARITPALPAVAAVALVAPLLVLGAVPSTGRPVRIALGKATPRQAAYPRAYAWLAAHTPKSDVVAWNRNVEFFPYAFSDYGVSPLFGIPSLIAVNNKTNVRDRYLTWDWLVDNGYGDHQPHGCLVQKFRVKYVVTGGHRIPGSYTGQLRHTNVQSSPNLQQVYRDGPVTIYEVNAQGRACATPPA